MNIVLCMTDKETGEILWQKTTDYSCRFVQNDAGRKLISQMIDSAIKGARLGRFINCSVDFIEKPFKEVPLPFQD